MAPPTPEPAATPVPEPTATPIPEPTAAATMIPVPVVVPIDEGGGIPLWVWVLPFVVLALVVGSIAFARSQR